MAFLNVLWKYFHTLEASTEIEVDMALQKRHPICITI